MDLRWKERTMNFNIVYTGNIYTCPNWRNQNLNVFCFEENVRPLSAAHPEHVTLIFMSLLVFCLTSYSKISEIHVDSQGASRTSHVRPGRKSEWGGLELTVIERVGGSCVIAPCTRANSLCKGGLHNTRYNQLENKYTLSIHRGFVCLHSLFQRI